MKQFFKVIFILTITSIVLVDCTEDEVTSREYPRLNTLPVSNITESGATFNAEFLFRGNSEIKSYGFAWSTLNDPGIDNADKVVAFENLTEPTFSLDAKSALKEGVLYYVRPFVSTDKYTVYGQQVEFVSLGSEAPKIHSFFPSTAGWGDTLKINGENFSNLTDKNKGYLGEVILDPIAATDSLLAFLIPAVPNQVQVSVSIELLGNTTEANEIFRYKKPKLLSFAPSKIFYLDTIIIRGENFNSNSIDYNQIFFGEKKGTLTIASDTLLKAVIPDGIASASDLIKVISNSFYVESNVKYVFKPPIITSISNPEPVFGDTIDFFGHYFGYNQKLNTIKIGDVEIEPLQTDSNKIRIALPITEKQFDISITNSLGQEAISNNLSIPDPIISQLSPDEGSFGDEIQIIGENYGYFEEIVDVYFNDQRAIIDVLSNRMITTTLPEGVGNPVITKVVVNEVETSTSNFYYSGPEVISIVPNNATWDEIISINGNNFPENVEDVIVKIGNQPAQIVSINTEEIKAKVPIELVNEINDLSVTFNEIEVELVNAFTLNAPEISSLSKLAGTWNDEITVSTNGFLLNPITKNQLLIDGVSCEIISGTKNTLTVKVPEEVVSKSSSIVLKCYNYEHQHNKNFELLAPSISSISTTVIEIGEELLINGQYFHPKITRNTISYNDVPIEVMSSSATIITAKLSDNIIGNELISEDINEPIILSNSSGSDSSENLMFKYPAPWETLANFNFGAFGKWFTVNSKGYFISADRSLYEFNYIDKRWTQLTSFPGDGGYDGSRYYADGFVSNDKIFYGLGVVKKPPVRNPNVLVPPKSMNDFWEYNPASNQWRRLNDTPFFGSGFEGATLNGESYFIRDTVFKYDHSNDNWSPISKLSENNTSTIRHFIFEDELHVCYLDRSTNLYVFSKFDQQQINWTTYFTTSELSLVNDVMVCNGNIYLINLDAVGVGFLTSSLISYINAYSSTFLRFNSIQKELILINSPNDQIAILPFCFNGLIYLDGLKSSNPFYRYDPNYSP